MCQYDAKASQAVSDGWQEKGAGIIKLTYVIRHSGGGYGGCGSIAFATNKIYLRELLTIVIHERNMHI